MYQTPRVNTINSAIVSLLRPALTKSFGPKGNCHSSRPARKHVHCTQSNHKQNLEKPNKAKTIRDKHMTLTEGKHFLIY